MRRFNDITKNNYKTSSFISNDKIYESY